MAALELAEDLERWLRGEPVRAHRVGSLGRFWRWCRRKPLIASLAAALLIAVVGGFSTSLVLWRQAVNNQDRAIAGEAQALASLKKEEKASRESEEHYKRLCDLVTSCVYPDYTRVLLTQATHPFRERILVDGEPILSFLFERRAHDSKLRELLAIVLTQLGAIRGMENRDVEARAFLERAADLWERWPPEMARSTRNRAVACYHPCLSGANP